MVRHWSAYFLAVVVALVTSFAAVPASAQAEWKLLGSATVNGAVDKDTIAVGADKGAFTAIEVKILGSALLMTSIKVTFDDNTTLVPPTKPSYNAGETTGPLDLGGKPRLIKQVELSYGNSAGGGNARVELLGKSAAAPPPPPPPPAQWVKLGEQTVNGKNDVDVIKVGADDGRFGAIQVKVLNSSLEMKDIVVTFGDGTSFSPPTKLVFGPGQTTRVIDLPGDKRVIKRVKFKYSNLPGGGNAKVELWGRR